MDGRVTYAKAILAAGNTSAAMQVLQQRLRVAPRDPDALDLYATAQLRAGHHAGAASSLMRYLEVRPNHAQTHYRLGLVFQRLGRPDEARIAFGRAAALERARRR